jgi:hypothetical protein
MKKTLLFLIIMTSFISVEVMGQCGRVSLIGEFNGWAGDHFMTRNPEQPELFTAFLSVDATDDGDLNGTVEMKFRENADWAVNWGAADFPAGTGTLNGPNVPVPFGSYMITFNCSTGAYNFVATCGEIGMIGEFNGWAGDQWMTRSTVSPDEWTGIVNFTTASDGDGDGDVEMKFRENADWVLNWGAADFPSGIGTLNGANIPVPIGSYLVTFNCATGAYNFAATCGEISMIGEFNGWAGDAWMVRNMASPNDWTIVLSLNAGSDSDADGDVEMKFRQNADWAVNWGAADFPTGTGVLNGANIPVPLNLTGLTTDYMVNFNCATGVYTFTEASGAISMIGAFNGWNGDIPMNRDAVNPNLWKLSRSWFANSDVKFRENKDWSVNWGDATFPTGTGTPNGANIPLVAGKYDVTFNTTTLEYNFTANSNFCGEIGLVGDFNAWGAGDPPTDVWMLRDPVYPSQFSLEYNFTASTQLLFRLDADQTFSNVWGGTFPEGTGVQDPTALIDVPGGKYQITFNCKSGDFKFIRLGNAVIAPKVFNILVDGQLNEADWVIDQNVSQVISGTVGDDPNTIYFGVTYNEDFLYVGLDVLDAALTPLEMGELFIDGNKNGGAYDANDLWIRFAGPVVIVMYPDTIEGIQLGFAVKPLGDGYTAELAIPWAELGVTAEEGAQIGFDLIISDSDSGTGVDYQMAWNGGLQNYEGTSSFGDLLFGTLSCGCITLYNSNVGDVLLQNPTDQPTYYVGNFEMFEDQNLLFRKDMDNAVTWGGPDFPTGVAELSGPAIPATTGRYRVGFDCLSGDYTFTIEEAGANVAYSEYTETPSVIDGDLSEYNLAYGSSILAEGASDNTVTWGSDWDKDNLYLAVKVVDPNVFAHSDPWNSDAIEYYIDGNHDRDGAYDSDFDTQTIQMITDPFVDTVLWLKADGVQFTNWESKILMTSDGYIVELRIGWEAFGFIPGKGRSLGFSLGNDDNDDGVARTGQTVWYGSGANWSDTGLLGDLQLAGGPYTFGIGDVVDYSNEIILFPNPSSGNVYLRMITDTFKGKVNLHIVDIAGRTIVNESHDVTSYNMIQLDASKFTSGIYFVSITGENGVKAVKKLIVQ